MKHNIDWSLLCTAADRQAQAQQALSHLVDIERARRVSAGFTFNGQCIQSGEHDRENILDKAMQAFMAKVGGAAPGDLRWADPDTDFVWIAADNTRIPMDAQTMMDLGKAMTGYKESLIFAARRLKDRNVIPADYADDQYWPA
jgi:hypothetical protein